MTNEDLILRVIEREGGFVNTLNDRGGPTKFGITLDTLSDWRKAPVSIADVDALSLNEAKMILMDAYLVRPGIAQIKQEKLRAAVFDYAVHSGPPIAIKALQRCVGAVADGIIGPGTLGLLEKFDDSNLTRKLIGQRIRHIGRIITNDKSQGKFAAGWLARIAEQVEALS